MMIPPRSSRSLSESGASRRDYGRSSSEAFDAGYNGDRSVNDIRVTAGYACDRAVINSKSKAAKHREAARVETRVLERFEARAAL